MNEPNSQQVNKLTTGLQLVAKQLQDIDKKIINFTTTGDVVEKLAELRRRINVTILAAFIFAVLLVGGFSYSLNRTSENEANQRKQAFCGLSYLFDQSIQRQSGGTIPDPVLNKAYQDWKADIKAIDCPVKEAKK
ncbi:MAG TPA: hypothetical protein VJ742_12365 [Nitrososphaera sp.]|nr:hypothetical protein [Nitrososphaera sp.]